MITVKIEGIDQVKRDLERRFGKAAVAGKIRAGIRAVKPQVKQVLGQEMRKAFKVRKSQFADKTWRISTDNSSMTIRSLVKWLMSQSGETIRPRGHAALLIPINTYLGARVTTKKFYQIVNWLRRENLSVIKNGILYAKPVWNTSRRGGVAAGSRINKKFRAQFQGSLKRPSGFSLADIKVIDGDRLVPIAVVRRSIRMGRRFVLEEVARRSIVKIVRDGIERELLK